MRPFDRSRISDEAKAAAARGETFESSCPYQPHTPAWRLYQSIHRTSSSAAAGAGGPLLSSGASVADAPAAVSHNDSRSL